MIINSQRYGDPELIRKYKKIEVKLTVQLFKICRLVLNDLY